MFAKSIDAGNGGAIVVGDRFLSILLLFFF